MGVIHKLRPDVRDFILEQKKNTPSLSCRDLISLILEQFHIDVSKSSINTILKENNLSMPIGRRQKLKKKKFNMPVLPVIEGIKAIALVSEPSRAVQGIVAKYQILRHSDPERNAKGKNLEADEILRPAAGLPQDDDKGISQHSQEEMKVKEIVKDVEEQKKVSLEQERIKEAEIWAIKLLEDERNRLEQARLAREEAQRKAGEEKLIRDEAISGEGAKPESTMPLSRESTGVILLKAIDYLLRGSAQLSEAIQRISGYPKEEAEALTQALIFQGIIANPPGALSSITRDEISADKLSGYLAQLQELKTINPDLSRLAAEIFREARGMKMYFSDGSIIYLDAQMRTVWHTPYMPPDFSAARTTVRDRVHRYFFKDGNLVLFMAPGHDIPSKEFFTLLLNFNSKNKTADNLILYGNKLDELESIALNPGEGRNLLFALWPWQWTAYRKVRRIGEFSLHHIDCIDKDFYLAEIEIELIQPTAMQSSTLKGCAIKLNLAEKIRLVVLSADGSGSLVSLANDYLCRWPNLDEGFQDFSRKIEQFSLTGESRKIFAYQDLPAGKSEPADLKSIFSGYAEALDTYLRWHFMPSGYEKTAPGLTKERFYSQKAQLIQAKDKMRCFFTVAHDYAYAKDLEYICRRLNERDIRADDGQRIYFESGFK